LDKHNLKSLLEQGLCVTVNSDDPAYFGGYVTQNYLETQQALNLSVDQTIQLAKNSFEASFLPAVEKKKYTEALNKLRTEFN
jgi:adenosine deaminase